jgi:hypothetical protein
MRIFGDVRLLSQVYSELWVYNRTSHLAIEECGILVVPRRLKLHFFNSMPHRHLPLVRHQRAPRLIRGARVREASGADREEGVDRALVPTEVFDVVSNLLHGECESYGREA